jgi:hypothetical protein
VNKSDNVEWVKDYVKEWPLDLRGEPVMDDLQVYQILFVTEEMKKGF